MIDKVNYEKYKKLKERLFFTENNIKYHNVIAFDIIRVVYNDSKSSIGLLDILKQFFKSIDLNKADLKAYFLKTDYVFTNGLNPSRADYNEQLKLIMQRFDRPEYLNIYQANTFYIDLVSFTRAIYIVFKKIGLKSGLLNTLYLAGRLCYNFNSYKALSRAFKDFDFSNKRYIAFYSSIGIEVLTSQFFSSKGVPTFALSHGISYVDYRKYVPKDAISGDNISVNNILVWGESSKDDLIKNYNFPEERIKVVGNLKYPLKEISVSQEFKRCIVLLGRPVYHESNLQLLSILAECQTEEMSFHIKLHPHLPITDYEGICKEFNLNIFRDNQTLSEILKCDSYDFAIVNNSTSYYEVMYFGCLCFRFDKDMNENFLGLNDLFSDSLTLRERIDYFKNIKSSIINKEIKNLLVKTLGMGEDRYHEIISNSSVI